MAPALDAYSYIHEGVWVNWSRGSVLGSTLTVSPKHAAILSPALAVLVSIAGAQLWRLFQYALHQARATSNGRNFVYHQSQSILRNTSTDLNALWRFIRLAIAWRHQRDVKVLKSLLPLILWTLLHLLLVVSVGLFSSWLLQANDEVLAQSPWCGTFNRTYYAEVYSTNENDLAAVTLAKEYSSYTNSRYAIVQQSVDICGSDSGSCIKPRDRPIPWTPTFVQDECPVNSSICDPNSGGSVSLDTGFLSSHDDLGYNAQSSDRVSVRMFAECAPLEDAGYVTGWQEVEATSISPARQAADAHYGPSPTNGRNSTYTITRSDMGCDERKLGSPYTLISHIALPNGSVKAGTATFDPIPELRVSDADLSLVLLSFKNAYDGPVTDPWFSAQQSTEVSQNYCLKENTTVYARSSPLTAMACTQKWQICNKDSSHALEDGQCTSPGGLSQVKAAINAPTGAIALTPRQNATAQRIIRAASGVSFYYVVAALSSQASPPLKARNMITTPVGPALPANQWQTEIEYWMQLVVAYFQQANLDYSTGQFAASTAYINVSKPSTSTSASSAYQDADHWLCQSQIIQSSDYRNFNFFALVLTVVLCVIIIILGMAIEDCTGYVRQRNLRYSGANGKQDMWIANSDLDMLRRIDELRNGTTWTVSRNGIPVTHISHKVGINDLMAEGHDVEKGTGIIVPSVKRRKNGVQVTELKADRHVHQISHGRCATCSTFDLTPTSDSSDVPQAKVTRGAGKAQNKLSFRNSFRRSFHADLSTSPMGMTSSQTNIIPSSAVNVQSQQHFQFPLHHEIGTALTTDQRLEEGFTYHNSINTTDDNFRQYSQKPDVEATSTYSDSSDSDPTTHRYQSFSSSPLPSSNRHTRVRTQDHTQVYEQPSVTTHGYHGDVVHPVSGWGVLPKRWSTLWGSSGWRRSGADVN